MPDLRYVDEGKSAYTNRIDKRPDFQRLLRDAQAKERAWSLVLVYKTDRFARDALLQLQCRRDLLKCGVRTESATQYNPDDSAIGKLNVVLDAGLNEYYSALLSERMKDVRRFEAEQHGRHVGPIPIGYARQNGRLIPDNRAPAWQFAAQLYLTGEYRVARITDALNEAGYITPDGEPFKVFGVEEMLKNPVYAGFVVCGGQLFKGNHEPLIDEAGWARMQQIAEQRSRRRTRPTTSHEPLLVGLMYCGNCGAPMWHFPRPDRRYYRCCTVPTRRPGPITDLICGDTYAYAETIEEIVLAWIGALVLSSDVIERARRRYSQPVARKAAVDDIELRRLKQAFLAERISAADYEVQRAALVAQGARAPEAGQPVDVEVLLQVLRDLPAVLAETTQAERRAALRQFVTEISAKRDRLLAFRPTRLAEGLLLAAAESDEWLRKVVESGPGGDPAQTYELPDLWTSAREPLRIAA